jgi:16S rRNA U516 pseudouridylate synthase RsuA-like enzyme
MAKPKRKLTRAEKAAKARRNAEFMTVFVNGKQKRVRRPPQIDGMDVEEFIRRNADPIWLHQNEMWEYMTPDVLDDLEELANDGQDDGVPF